MGYKGNKVALFVLPERSTFRDTNEATGEIKFRMRLLEKASQDKIKAAALGIP